jgi:hypothetical protein
VCLSKASSGVTKSFGGVLLKRVMVAYLTRLVLVLTEHSNPDVSMV